MKKKKVSFNKIVYELVKRIPCGQVTTYGEIARKLDSGGARQVGWALHQNKSASVPCHRVVDRSGRLAPNFGFGGYLEQKRRLEGEGVKFLDEMHVDLAKNFWGKATK